MAMARGRRPMTILHQHEEEDSIENPSENESKTEEERSMMKSHSMPETISLFPNTGPRQSSKLCR